MQITVAGFVTIELETNFERQTIRRALELYKLHEESNLEKEALCQDIVDQIDRLPSDV